MKQVIFDFDAINSMEEFYAAAIDKLQLPEYFGNNLDAMWDSLTAGIELPVDIKFINLTVKQLEIFDDMIFLFEDAAINLEEELFFEYSLKEEDDELFFNDVEL